MRHTVVFLALGIALGPLSPGEAHASPRIFGNAAKSAAKPEKPPTLVDKKVKLSPDGLAFGMTIEEISKLYEKVFDEEFVPLYKKTEPGPRMSELDSELADKKQLILRNKLEFGTLPSGLDNTPLAGEYSYNNGESMTQVKLRSGVQRYFFFFGDHLWKVYDVHKLNAKSKLGEDFDTAVANLTKQFGKPPRARKADLAAGIHLDQDDWEDKETIVRIADRGNGAAALMYVDRKIEDNIAKYRPNKGPAAEEVDRDVSDVTRPGKIDDKNKGKAQP
jgi:hypothetical protein